MFYTVEEIYLPLGILLGCVLGLDRTCLGIDHPEPVIVGFHLVRHSSYAPSDVR